MAAKIKFFISKNRGKAKSKKKSDEVNILIRFSNGRKFDLIALSQQQIKPVYWNNDSGKVREIAAFNDRDKLQKRLDEIEQFVLNEFKDSPDKSAIDREWLNKAIDKYFNPSKYSQGNTLFGYIQKFIDNSTKRINPHTGNPVCYKMRREYQVTFDYLKEYAKFYGEPDFVDIDLEFYQRFVDFLRNYSKKDKEGKIVKIGLAVNTIGKKVQTLKIFLNDATEQGVNNYQRFKSSKFKSLTEESENIYLTKDELKKFYEYDFSSRESLERVRDLFIVGCWTGLRYSDLSQITPDKIKDNLIHIKQRKTGGKVIIPLHYTVREILKKYDGKLPKQISNQKYNDYLKDAAKIAEINSIFVKTASEKGMNVEKKYKKHELISSHTARRSFCTNAYKDGVPAISIMAISGHRTERSFLKYIKVEPEDHANKVLKMWQSSGEFLTVAK